MNDVNENIFIWGLFVCFPENDAGSFITLNEVAVIERH